MRKFLNLLEGNKVMVWHFGRLNMYKVKKNEPVYGYLTLEDEKVYRYKQDDYIICIGNIKGTKSEMSHPDNNCYVFSDLRHGQKYIQTMYNNETRKRKMLSGNMNRMIRKELGLD